MYKYILDVQITVASGPMVVDWDKPNLSKRNLNMMHGPYLTRPWALCEGSELVAVIHGHVIGQKYSPISKLLCKS